MLRNKETITGVAVIVSRPLAEDKAGHKISDRFGAFG